MHFRFPLFVLAGLSCSFFLQGCTQEKDNALEPENEIVENQSLSPVKKISLASLVDRVTLKSYTKKPLIGEKYLVDYNHGRIQIYDKNTMQLNQSLDVVALNAAPVFINTETLLLVKDKQLVLFFYS